jgi:hypothetical protein
VSFYRRIEYLNENLNIPIFELTSDHFTARNIAETLLDKDLPLSKIATSRPVGVQNNMVFVVDLSQLSSHEDIRADDLGSWTCNGKRSQQCIVDDFGRVIDILSKVKPRKQLVYTLVKRYYRHSTSPDFRKVIAEIFGKQSYVHVKGDVWRIDHIRADSASGVSRGQR